MATLQVIPDEVFKQYVAAIQQLGEGKATLAFARAINRVVTTIEGRVVKAIRHQSQIRTNLIRAAIRHQLASVAIGSTLEGKIIAQGKPIPVSVSNFGGKQFSFGVRAKWDGAFHTFDQAFMGPSPGVLAPALHGLAFRRTSNTRFPIEVMYGPAVPEEMIRDESAKVYETTVLIMLPERIGHELGRMLPAGT